jgi:hypothetical protein
MIENYNQLWNHANNRVMQLDSLRPKFVMSKELKYVCESKGEGKSKFLQSFDEIFTE